MKDDKTGVSMGSKIINTRDKKHYAIQNKNNSEKNNRAEICISCKDNNEGFCKKHKNWCGKVNYICNGSKNPYKTEYDFSKIKKVKKHRKCK